MDGHVQRTLGGEREGFMFPKKQRGKWFRWREGSKRVVDSWLDVDDGEHLGIRNRIDLFFYLFFCIVLFLTTRG